MSHRLAEIPFSDTPSEFWEKMTSKMVQVVWHYNDVSIPFRDHDCYDSFSQSMPGLKLMLGVTNLIDSLVDDIIESDIKTAVSTLSAHPSYSDISLYLALQDAAEIVHKRVYKTQFDLVVSPQERNEMNAKARSILNPLVEIADNASPPECLLLCVVIEGLLIPTVFSFINDLKDINIDNMDVLAKQIITTILAANRLILRDEMLHISGGSELVRQLVSIGLISYGDIDNMISKVCGVVHDLIDNLSLINDERYNQILSDMIEVLHKSLRGFQVEFGDYNSLSFVKAMIPSIDGFFKGSVTSYLNGDVKQIESPIIE